MAEEFRGHEDVIVSRGDNVTAVRDANIVVLAVDPADVASVLGQEGIAEALSDENKLLISVAAGWTREQIETQLWGSASTTGDRRAWVLRTLPNIAAQVGESLTAIEVSEPALPDWCLGVAESIFSLVGKTVRIPPSLMAATTAVGGSTPAFFAVICDALIDAAVAVGVPRPMAHTMIFQSMLGTATMMRDGLHPALLRDQGTSPEGCTIGGLMVMEEAAIRGHMGKALREAVTIARQMGTKEHLNDTRQ
jgi:pyrroline-5-carboxylate reductase